jgi:uncharacterized membrane protein
MGRSVQGKATFRGHPVHLMLVPFPVAFWTGALATDAVGAYSHDPFWFRMSVALLAMGSLGAIVAAVFGYIDYLTIPMSRRAKKIATQHMLTSLAAILVFPAAWLLRRHDHVSLVGIGITLIGAVVLFVAGYFGSELSNRFGVGISEKFPEEAAAAAGE